MFIDQNGQSRGEPADVIGALRAAGCPLKILIIDDEPDILKIAEVSLRSLAHWNVKTASTSAEGISIARDEAPDVVLLDMNLPGTNEASTIAMLKQGPETCIILMTAAGRSDRAHACLAMGAWGIIGKPFDPLALAATILGILDNGKTMRTVGRGP